MANDRVDAVSTRQHLGLGVGAVGEARLDVVAAVDQADELVVEMDTVLGQGVGQGGQQVGAMDLVLREASGVRSRVRPSSQRRWCQVAGFTPVLASC